MLGIIFVLQGRSRDAAELRIQEELEVQLDYIGALIDSRLDEKTQYLQDQVRLRSTIELYYHSVDL